MQFLQPNTTLQGGKYRIERVLGQGGFGITYLAMQTSLQRKVAIKEFFMKDFCSRDGATSTMLGSSIGSNKLVEQYKKKFVKEARNLAKLNHPNIINVIDVFEENDTVYYAMPYLSGGSLQDYVKSCGALSEKEALKYVRQIAKALKYMHEEQHMCHYDVKPANILLDDKGNAVLIDFGISKGYDEGGHETSTTPIGLSEGYAPIEQYQQGLEEFSPASDVYALGATFYFLLHGRVPVSASKRVGGMGLQLSQKLSKNAKDIINTSMKLSRAERPNNVGVFFRTKNKALWRYVLLAIITLVIVGVFYMINHNQSRNTPIEKVSYEDYFDNGNNNSSGIINGSVNSSHTNAGMDAQISDNSSVTPTPTTQRSSSINTQQAHVSSRNKVSDVSGHSTQLGNRENSEGRGLQSSQNSNSGNSATEGTGGYGSFSLGGRSLGSGGLPRPMYNGSTEGRVVVDITVNPEGQVISTGINSQTNTDNLALHRAAEEAAQKARFNKVESANNQIGTITYYFRNRNQTATSVSSNVVDQKIYDIVDEPAEFLGGDTALMQWLSTNLKYPAEAQDSGTQGLVSVRFVIERDGAIGNVEVISSVDPFLEKEAVRVVKSMPKWIPGKIDGNPVRSYFSLPITFRLQ